MVSPPCTKKSPAFAPPGLSCAYAGAAHVRVIEQASAAIRTITAPQGMRSRRVDERRRVRANAIPQPAAHRRASVAIVPQNFGVLPGVRVDSNLKHHERDHDHAWRP